MAAVCASCGLAPTSVAAARASVSVSAPASAAPSSPALFSSASSSLAGSQRSLQLSLARTSAGSSCFSDRIRRRGADVRCDSGPSAAAPSSRSGESRSATAGAAAASAVPFVDESSDSTQLAEKPKLVTYDYGFQAEFLRSGPSVPHNVFKLAFENFGREYLALRRNLLFEDPGSIPENASPRRKLVAKLGRVALAVLRGIDKILTVYDGLPTIKPAEPLAKEGEELRQKIQKLTLSNEGVMERERRRPPVPAPWWILAPYYALCWMLDVIFDGRPFQRFWFLETVARMPYFSYISMLHLYETLGWWRVGAEVRKVHFAEEWNEMNHLKIMESLGGDRLWVDRFFAQHAAFFYYWILNIMFLISPRVAYNFSELIEAHAVDTYGEFVDENAELLKTLPPPPAAINYYNNEDLYMFDEFQTSRLPETRRPKMESLYDVFCAIRDDESEHVKTMWACQQLDYTVASPHRVKAEAVRKQQAEGKAEVGEVVPETEGVQEAANKGNFLSKWFN